MGKLEIATEADSDWGVWSVVRQHSKYVKASTKDTFCGQKSDQFSIKCDASKFCAAKHNSSGQWLVNAADKQVATAYFCCNQGETKIVSKEFQASDHCDPKAGQFGYWTVTRKVEGHSKERVDTFCGMKTATFSIGEGPSNYCDNLAEYSGGKYENAKAGWVLLDQNGDQHGWAFYCNNQAKPEIVSAVFKVDAECDASLSEPSDTEDEQLNADTAETDDDEDHETHECGYNPADNRNGCTDMPNQWMKDRGNDCSAGWITRQRCNRETNTLLANWQKCQYCAHSCFWANAGYEGLECTPKAALQTNVQIDSSGQVDATEGESANA